MSESSAQEPIHEPCAGCGALLNVTTFGPFDPVICPTCKAETHVKKDFGTYRLEQRHAVGGMSVIFAGWDTTLDRKVAIKVLNEEFCNDEVRIQSFENEARLTAQVSHPNVVKVYAVGRAYGRFYLVMELLKGRSFEQIIAKRGALPEDEVLDIAIQVGAGLRAAKKAGMIHRDVKPGNILIDEAGHARLLDFGLALITQDGRAQAEEVWATPYYVPPEALERGIEDFRSDIYAFGASLYHALAGRPAFESTSTSNSLLRRAKQTIPRLCKVAPWISPITGEVIDRMMAFEPRHRWSSYGQVLSALQNARKSSGKTVTTPVHSRNRLKRRRRKSYFGLIFMFLLVTLLTGLIAWKPWNKTKAPDSADAPDVGLPDFDKAIFNPGGGPGRELYDLWRNARELVQDQKYAEASNAFVNLSKEPTLAGMPQVWASFEASVCSLLGGRPGMARDLVGISLRDLDRLTKQRSLQRNYRETARVLQGIPPPETDDFPTEPDDVSEWMLTFALALKQWEQGQWKLALPNFARVRGAVLPDEVSWFAIYQNLADLYLADGLILRRIDALVVPGSDGETTEQINLISAAIDELQTEGRALYNLRARQAYLARMQRHFSEAKPTQIEDNWESHRGLLRKKGRNLAIKEMSALLNNPPADAPRDSLWAWRFLTRNAGSFLRDLASRDDWTATGTNGQQLSPVSGNVSGIRLADGTFVPWKELKAAELLDEHRGQAAHAIAFAWLAGLTGDAEDMAEDLAGRSQDFQSDWKRVILGITQ